MGAASIGEIISTVQQAVNAVNNAVTACGAAIQQTSDLQSQLAAAGVRDKVQQVALAKDAIEKYPGASGRLGRTGQPRHQSRQSGRRLKRRRRPVRRAATTNTATGVAYAADRSASPYRPGSTGAAAFAARPLLQTTGSAEPQPRGSALR
jgi:hypothetical protein